jgi:hypothetical protein
MEKIIGGSLGRGKYFLIKNNSIVAEISKNCQVCRIKFRNYTSPDGAVMRYYIERNVYIIGWINKDLSVCKGKNKNQQEKLEEILSAMKNLCGGKNTHVFKQNK